MCAPPVYGYVTVCEHVCVLLRECVLCDPGNADQRVKMRAIEGRLLSIHLLPLTDLVRLVFIY